MHPSHDIQKVESRLGYFYHATNYENALNIAREGLKPHRPWHGTDQDAWPDGSTERRSYFTEHAEIAWQFAPELRHAVLLRVRSDIPAKFFYERYTRDVYVTGQIPPWLIEFYGEDSRWCPIHEIE